MAISDIVASMKENLTNAYNALEEKGATIPDQKNLESLAATIETVTGSGAAEIDFGPHPEAYAAIKGLTTDLEVQITYLTESEAVGLLQVQYDMTPLQLFQVIEVAFPPQASSLPVEVIPSNFLLKMNPTDSQYSGTNVNPMKITGMENLTQVKSIGDNFLYYMTYGAYNKPIGLREFSGLPANLESIGNSFLRSQPYFNQPITLPDTVATIGTYAICYNASLNSPVTLSLGLRSIGDYTLSGNTVFNAPVVFKEGLEALPNSFMSSLTAFNQPIELPNSLKSIGLNVFSALQNFNSSVTLPAGLQILGGNFLGSCPAFNQPVEVPEGLTTMGSFIQYSPAFNQPITLPASLTTLTSSLLNHMSNFTGPITINCPVSVLNTLSSSNKDTVFTAASTSVPAYTQGISLAGPYAADWKDALPDSSIYTYRKLVLEA